jgi:hypothetical protein
VPRGPTSFRRARPDKRKHHQQRECIQKRASPPEGCDKPLQATLVSVASAPGRFTGRLRRLGAVVASPTVVLRGKLWMCPHPRRLGVRGGRCGTVHLRRASPTSRPPPSASGRSGEERKRCSTRYPVSPLAPVKRSPKAERSQRPKSAARRSARCAAAALPSPLESTHPRATSKSHCAFRQEGFSKGGPVRHVGGEHSRLHAVPLPAHAPGRLAGGNPQRHPSSRYAQRRGPGVGAPGHQRFPEEMRVVTDHASRGRRVCPHPEGGGRRSGRHEKALRLQQGESSAAGFPLVPSSAFGLWAVGGSE